MVKKPVSFSLSEDSVESIISVSRALGLSISSFVDLMIKTYPIPKGKVNRIRKLQEELNIEMFGSDLHQVNFGDIKETKDLNDYFLKERDRVRKA